MPPMASEDQTLGDLLKRLHDDDDFRKGYFEDKLARGKHLEGVVLSAEERELLMGDSIVLSFGEGGVLISTDPGTLSAVVAFQAKCSYTCN